MYIPGGLLAAVLAAGFAPDARAQAPTAGSVERFERTLEQIRRETREQVVKDVPVGRRALFDYGGYFTFSYLSLDDPEDHNLAFRGYDLVGYGRINFDGIHDFYLRGRGTYRDYNAGDSFDGEGDHLEGHVEEAYYRLDAGRLFSLDASGPDTPGVIVQVGRQFETWANGLVLSQYVDAVRGLLEFGAVEVELLASITANDYTVDFDSSRPEFDDETRRGFYGALLSVRRGPHRPFAYALIQRDHNDNDQLTDGPLLRRFGYDSYYLGVGANGSLSDRLSYGAEFVYEGGEALSRGGELQDGVTPPPGFEPEAQSEEDIHAFAAELHLDYVPGDDRRTRLGTGVLLASGDDDRLNSSTTVGGNQPGTDDTAFNALGYVDDGVAFAPELSNIIAFRATASSYPWTGSTSVLDRLQLGLAAFVYLKFDDDAPITEPTIPGARYLGFEPDVFVNWQIYDDLFMAMRYGVFFPGEDAFESTHARHFFYAGLTYAF
jgi:hypothetical protein